MNQTNHLPGQSQHYKLSKFNNTTKSQNCKAGMKPKFVYPRIFE